MAMDLLNTETIVEGLNPPQRQAVETTEGPLLIQAGAGSGKTKTLTHRIAYIIASGLARPAEILAVTFTNKAAGEMRERLAGLLRVDNSRSFMPWMGTFHSIAVRLLRYYGDAIGVSSNFVIFDESDRLVLVKSILKDLGATDKQYNPRTIVSYISNAKNDCQSPEEYYRQATHSPMQQMAAEVYMRYAKRMHENEALDFDDLLLEAVRLLEEAPEVRDKLRDRFKYILIDEYQDTNRAQYRLVKLLLNEHHTNILNFERDFPGATVIKLEQNYRSTEEILNAAHNVIAKNTQRSDKKLWTDNRGGAPVEIIKARNEFDEAERVANSIQLAVAVGSRNYRDCAVLYRTNAQSRVFEQMFLRDGVPYKIIGGLRFYDRAEIKDLTAYLKLLYQPRDTISFRRIVNVPKRGLGEVSVGKFLAWQEQSGMDVIEALAKVHMCSDITPKAKNSLANLGSELADIRKQSEASTPDQVVEAVVKRFGYDTYIDDGTDQGEARKENVGELISMAKEYGDLASFLEEVALISGADVTNHDDAVTLMTLHAAKGLEFPVVYEELYLSYAVRRTVRGEQRINMPSAFLADALGEDVSSLDHDGVDEDVDYGTDYDYDEPNYGARFNQGYGQARRRSYTFSDEPHYEPEQVNLAIGDKVRHQMFGMGRVTSVEGSVVEVYFTDGHTRKLNVAFAPLTKVG